MAASKSNTDRAAHPKTPVTIITGFLGAGKTTLLNYILKEKGNRSIAVIENEFGEVNIDTELVADNLLAKEDLVSLENGCVCCSLRKDIVKAFAEIERRSRHSGKRVDAIVLETTGLADPAPVAFTFFANPWLATRFRLDSIICVVDARYLLQHLEDGKHSDGTVNEAVQQIAFADLILLNKVDLVKDDEAKRQVMSAIKSINNSARIIECQLNQETGRPPMDTLLFNNLFSVNRVLEQIDPQFLDSDSDSEAGEDADPSSPLSAGVEHERQQQQQPDEEQQQQQQAGSLDPGEPERTASADSAVAAAAGTAAAAAGERPGSSPHGAGGCDGLAAAASGVLAGSDGAEPAAVSAGAGAGVAPEGQDAAARSAGPTGLSPRSQRPASSAAAQILRKHGGGGAGSGSAPPHHQHHHHHQHHQHEHEHHLTGHKHSREEPCEDNCEECHIVDGMKIKGERNPKRRAKRLHDLSDVSSVGIIARGQLDEYRFNMYMRDLLSEKAKDIFRCKGVLSVHGYGNTKFVFQGVHETICYGPAEQPWKQGEPRVNQVVFIGRGLDRKALIEGFRTCVWVPLPDGWDEFRDERTKQPYYVHRGTGEKSWTRPEAACARVVATQGATQQPSQLLPKRQPSQLSAQAHQAAVQAAAAHLPNQQQPQPQPLPLEEVQVAAAAEGGAGGPAPLAVPMG